MRVILETALFDPAQPNPLELIAIVQLGFEGRHLVVTDPLEDPTVDAWLASRDQLGNRASFFRMRIAGDGGLGHGIVPGESVMETAQREPHDVGKATFHAFDGVK